MKRLVGYLCYASFISAVFFATYYVYLAAAPFFRGGQVRVYYDPRFGDSYASNQYSEDVGRLISQLAAHGLEKSDETLLRGYATGVQPMWVHRGWAALGDGVASAPTAIITRTPETNVAWAALADAGGRVVASYPADLAKTIGRVSLPTLEAWGGAFRPGQRGAGELRVFPISNDRGKKIGSLAVAWKPQSVVAVIPPEAEVRGMMAPITALVAALWSLLAFVILLPTWVAMDAEWRGMRPFAWAALIVLTGPVGLAAYLISRLGPPKACPNCGKTVLGKFKRCPSCGVSLPSECPVCRTPFKPGWQFCPKCDAAPLDTAGPPAPVEEAAATAAQSALSVIVQDADGAPVPNSRITVQGESAIDGMTNARGRFEARNLEPGQYSVTANKDGYESSRADVEVAQDVSAEARLVLKAKPGEISGRVLDRSGLRLLSGARVFIDSTRLDRSAATDADGAYILQDVPPGPYTVRAEADGHTFQTRLAELDPGRRIRVDFVLEAETEKENPDAAE